MTEQTLQKRRTIHEMPNKISQQSTSEQTMMEYYRGGPLKNVIEKVEAAQDALQHSRKKIQKFLANIGSPQRPKHNSLTLSSRPLSQSNHSRGSVGRIINQANSVHRLLQENTKQQLKDVGNAESSRKYFLNEQIIQTLRQSIEQQRKSNRIFEKQLKVKRQLLNQLRSS